MDSIGVQRLGGGVKGNLFQDKSNLTLKCSLKDVIKLGLLKKTESLGISVLDDIEYYLIPKS